MRGTDKQNPGRHCAVVPALLASALFCSSPMSSSNAGDDLEHCDAILKGDLTVINDTSQDDSGSSKESLSDKEMARDSEQFFSKSEAAAYEEYKNAYDNKAGTNINVSGEGHYGFIGGAASFAKSYNHELSKEEFSQEYNTHQSEYFQNGMHIKNKELVTSTETDQRNRDSHVSHSRDENSVDAWKSCVALLAKKQPGLYATGYRDRGNRPYVTVAWEPGPFAAALPRIEVTLAIDDDELEVKGEPTLTLTIGSRSFGIGYKDDARHDDVISEAFTVRVNGSVTDESGEPVVSQQAPAEIPAVEEKRPMQLQRMPIKLAPTTVIHLPPSLSATPSPTPPKFQFHLPPGGSIKLRAPPGQ